MKDLREKCERLYVDIVSLDTYADAIEFFAREMITEGRRQMREEAASAVQALPTFDRIAGPRYAKYFSESVQIVLRSLKTDAEKESGG